MNLMKRYLCLYGAVLVMASVVPSASRAATRTWDGGGTNGFWDLSVNWSGNLAPTNGDVLTFPTNVARLVNTNRAAGGLTNFSALRFSGDGYQIFSVPLNLTNGLTNVAFVGKANTLNAELRLRANQSWFVDNGTTLLLGSNVVFG